MLLPWNSVCLDLWPIKNRETISAAML
jgi:hypothetical protein